MFMPFVLILTAPLIAPANLVMEEPEERTSAVR